MKNSKLPSSTVLIFGGLGAFWIAGQINPGFFPIGVMIFLLIPVLIFDLLYPESEIDKLLVPGKPTASENTTIEEPVIEESTSAELVEESPSFENM